jgi:hypothetical protein
MVNIVEMVQTNLSKNFSIALRRLSHHTHLAQSEFALRLQPNS